MPVTRPMKAYWAKQLSELWFPCCATPKVDGIRALRVDGQLLTRSFKLVPNEHIRARCAGLPDGLDGELTVGESFQSTTSGIMRRWGTPDFVYHVFDSVSSSLEEPYLERVARLMAAEYPPFVRVLQPTHLYTLEEFLDFEEACLANGYEGVMTRSAVGPYKCGRSTHSEHYLVKYKRVMDSEAVIVSVHEGRTNLNPIVPNAFGYARRPGGRVHGLSALRGTMGYVVCKDVITGVEIRVGSGFNDDLRAAMWADPFGYIGRVIRYKYQDTGVKDKPRFPRFDAFRED